MLLLEGIVNILENDWNFTIKSVLTQPINTSDSCRVIFTQNDYFSLICIVPGSSFGVDSFGNLLGVAEFHGTHLLSDHKYRQIVIRRPVLDTSCLEIKCAPMMRAHHLVIEWYRIFHRFISLSFVQGVLVRTLAPYGKQLTLVPDDQDGVIAPILVLDPNRVQLIVLDVLALAYLDLYNFFHLSLCLVGLADLLAQGADLCVIGHEVFFRMEHRECSYCQSQ